jgi:hypothetical protein
MKAKRLLSLALLAVITITAQSQTMSTQSQQTTNGIKVGLKAFIEGGYAIGENMYSEIPVSLLATMGYQASPHLFVGLGSGENYLSSSGVYGIPLFADVRITTLNKSNSPFIDAKIGYSIADIKGLYLSPSIGYRFGSSINTAFTISVGYELQKVKTSLVNQYGYKSTTNFSGLNFKFGFDF